MNRTPLTRTLVATTVVTILALGATPADAHHVFAAEHAAPVIATAGDPLTLDVAAVSSCAIFLCSYVQVEVHYRSPDGRPTVAWNEGPYQAAQTIPVTIPAAHVRAPAFDYTVIAYQQDCMGDCHTNSVELPRLGESYSVRIDG